MAQTRILLESGTNELELVEFYIDEIDPETGEPYRGYYGVNVAKVLEIIRMPEISPMPDQPHEAVLGAFDLRGSVLPLVDLACWLKKELVPTDDPRIIVSEFNRIISAFMVTGVTRIHRVSWEDIEPPGEHVSTFTSDNITGVVRMDDHILLVLDMEKILAELNPESAMRLKEKELEDVERRREHYRVLIADDSSAIRKLMNTILTNAGFETIQAHNGREAWEMVFDIKKRAEREGKDITHYLDLVISDVEMPAMDGHTLCKRIKDDHELRELPVILFSSLITDKLRHKGESVGADDQISKPDITKLAERSIELIDKCRSYASG